MEVLEPSGVGLGCERNVLGRILCRYIETVTAHPLITCLIIEEYIADPVWTYQRVVQELMMVGSRSLLKIRNSKNGSLLNTERRRTPNLNNIFCCEGKNCHWPSHSGGTICIYDITARKLSNLEKVYCKVV